jgi:large subunit ribosomal protein L18
MAKPHGDEVLVSAHSRDLTKDFGWKSSHGNLPSAYLTGLLCGSKAKAKDIGEVVLDLGLHSPSKGAKVFAVLKGVIDAGIEVPHSEEKLPEEKRMEGEHIAKYATILVPNSEAYKSRFSNYLKQELPPEDLPKHFAEVKESITAAFKSGGKKLERRKKKEKT